MLRLKQYVLNARIEDFNVIFFRQCKRDAFNLHMYVLEKYTCT
jgi:hypothetical protein